MNRLGDRGDVVICGEVLSGVTLSAKVAQYTYYVFESVVLAPAAVVVVVVVIVIL